MMGKEYHKAYVEHDLSQITPASEPQKKKKEIVFDYFCDLKSRIEDEIKKPLEDSLLGITADNAYIAGLKTALRFSNETAGYIIDESQESIFNINDCSDCLEKIESQLDFLIEKMRKLNVGESSLLMASVPKHNTFFWLKRSIENQKNMPREDK